MRTATVAELATLAKLEREVTVRVKVQNGSGTMIDLSRWVESYSIDHDVDQPVGGATVAFRRDSGSNQYVTQSLSPLRTDSILNVNDGGAYAPILDLNRAITIEVATTNIGAVIVAADYKMMFDGTIDIVNWEDSPVVVTCRDGMAPLVDGWIETEAFFGTTPVGTPIQDVMDDVSDSVFGAGVEPVYTPVDPLYDIVRYRQQKMSVMDSWIDLMQLRGLDIREKWHDGTSAFRHTLQEPPRTKTVPDHTFTPNKYITVSTLNLELTNIRNAIQVSYRNSADLGNRAVVTRTDGPSITKYKRRFFLIQEDDSSPIDTSAEATLMGDAALADLKEPKAEQEVEMPFFWPAELGDLYRYSDNKVHYNTDQDWAVVEIKHIFALKHHRTIIKVRGSPIGQYNTWLGRGGTMGPGGGPAGAVAKPPYPFITPLNTEGDDTDWDLRFDALNGSGGGGTNLTYTIKSKKTFGTETTLVTGDASAFPDDVTIVRDLKQDSVISFRTTDAATGMFAEATFVVPAFVPLISATGTVSSQFYTNQVSAGSRGSAQTSDPLTATDVGATATVSIAAHDNKYGFGNVSYNSGSITGLAFSTKYYIYADDPTFAGGAVTYGWTQDVHGVVSNSGRYYVGNITTPADGGGPSAGGGGGGCVAREMWLSPALRADHARRGDKVDLWIGDSETEVGYVFLALPSRARECVELVAESGAKLVLSFDTRVTLKNGSELIVLHMQKDDALPVLHPDGHVAWERVQVKPVGLRQVIPLNVANGTFAAGDSPTGPRIFTHNIKVI